MAAFSGKSTKCTLCRRVKLMNEEHCDQEGRAWANVDCDGPVCPTCVRDRLVYDETTGGFNLKQ